MKLFPNVPVAKKPEVTPEPIVSEENLLFAIESEKNPHLGVHTDTSGNLVALENLSTEEMEKEYDVGVSIEELALSEIGAEPAAGPVPGIVPKMPRTVFIKSDALANVYLHGNCSESLDMLIHVLAHAPKDMEVNISYCGAWISVYDMMELVGAITASEATVNIGLTYCRSPLEMLLIGAADNVSLAAGYVIQPVRSNQAGSVKNIEETTRAERAYLDIVYENLIVSGILTKDEVEGLSDDNSILFLKGSDIQERIKS